MHKFESYGPIFFEVLTDPNLMYFPKVSSQISTDGKMSSAAIHDMTPKLDPETAAQVFKYLPADPE